MLNALQETGYFQTLERDQGEAARNVSIKYPFERYALQ
jgi:curli biogenesis system outer membrane secretion channel CsgG